MADAPIRTPTEWRPASGFGSVVLIGNIKLIEAVYMLPIVDNTNHLPLLTTPTVTLPKNATLWSQTG